MKRNLLLVTGLVLASTAANATPQLINCKFADLTNSDHIVVALTNSQAGTLMYSTGPQDSTADATNGAIILNRIADTADTATFTTQVEVMQMNFRMPKAQVSKIGVNFKATLHTSISGLNSSQDQDLSCSAI